MLLKLRQEWKKTRGSSLARNAGWMFLGQGLSILCQGVYFVLIGRLLGSAEYGVYVGAVAMVSVLSQYSPIGSHSIFLRYVSPDHSRFALYWGNVLATTLTMGTLFVVLLTLIGPLFSHSYLGKLIFCIALGDCLCAQLTIAAGRVFQAFEKMRITAALNLLVNLLRALLAGVMLWQMHHGNATQWAIAALAVSIAGAVTGIVLVTRLCGKPEFSFTLAKRHIGEGFVFALSYSTTGVYNDIDKAMLGHFGMNVANGIYTMAYRVVDVFTMPISSVQAAAFPRFFREAAAGVQHTAGFALQIIKRTAPLALLSAAGMFLAAPLIPFMVGNGFSESVSVLRLICLLPLFRSFHLAAGDAITAAGHQKLRLASQATAAAFNLGVNLYLIPLYFWRGAAWSSLFTDGMLAIFNWSALTWIAREKKLAPGIDDAESA